MRPPTLIVIGVYLATVAATVVWDVYAARPGIPIALVTRDDAIESIHLLKDWSIWMAGIDVAIVAAMSVVLKDYRPRYRWLPPACLLALALSLLAATWLLGTLPRLASGLSGTPAAANDVFGKIVPFYLWPPHLTIPVRVGLMIVFEHMFFLMGVGLFSWQVLTSTKTASK